VIGCAGSDESKRILLSSEVKAGERLMAAIENSRVMPFKLIPPLRGFAGKILGRAPSPGP
jgi:hypothetical protein